MSTILLQVSLKHDKPASKILILKPREANTTLLIDIIIILISSPAFGPSIAISPY